MHENEMTQKKQINCKRCIFLVKSSEKVVDKVISSQLISEKMYVTFDKRYAYLWLAKNISRIKRICRSAEILFSNDIIKEILLDEKIVIF